MSTKTTKKTTQEQATKKEFTLKPLMTMWIYKSEKGNKYLSGKTEVGTKVKGFFNAKKQNPKEPDVRIYVVLEDGKVAKEEALCLWCNVTEAGKKYFTGKYEGKRVVGFINSKAEINGTKPYINVYFSEEQQKIQEPVKVEQEVEADELPY